MTVHVFLRLIAALALLSAGPACSDEVAVDPRAAAEAIGAPAVDDASPFDEATQFIVPKPGTAADATEGRTEAPAAENIDLSEPLYEAESPPPTVPPVPEAIDISSRQDVPRPDGEEPAALVLLGETVYPGTAARLSWSLDQRFEGITVATPVLVVNGSGDGPTVCLTSTVHGDELNGIEIVRRVLYDLDPSELKGAVIGVPIVNLPSFRRGSRYLPDRRDLNRYFPGTPHGSAASRIAYSFFNEVITFCDALVDIHTGSLHRANLPQLRADMRMPAVAALTQKFGATAVLHNAGGIGTLRRATVDAGIPAVTLETGEPFRLHESDIAHGTKGIQTLLDKLGMQSRVSIWGKPEPVYYQSTWVRADRGGLLFGEVELGQKVSEGQLLGVVSDPITNLRSELRAPLAGRVLGMALNQVVMPGFAAFRIGIPTTESQLMQPEDELAPPADDEHLRDEEEDERS